MESATHTATGTGTGQRERGDESGWVGSKRNRESGMRD